MASLYQRPRSKFWWIKFKDSTGRTRRKSTKLRWDSAADTKKANLERNRRELTELGQHCGDEAQKWGKWAESFLALHYDKLTLRSYSFCWRNLSAFLRAKDKPFPSQLTYADCGEYVVWRTAGDAKNGIRPGGRNTALCELKVLAILAKEAARRGYIPSNPVVNIGIRREKPKEKIEITPEHLQLIHARLADEPEWMMTSFIIALYTGCRITETRIEIATCVDLERRQLRFADPKGGTDRAFTVPMRDELIPLFTRLIASGAAWTYEPQRLASLQWCKFFRRIGLPQYSFHCLRVTFISRGARAGVDERAMRRLVNHADSTIHKLYQRFTTDDLRGPLFAIPLPSLEKSPDSPAATA